MGVLTKKIAAKRWTLTTAHYLNLKRVYRPLLSWFCLRTLLTWLVVQRVLHICGVKSSEDVSDLLVPVHTQLSPLSPDLFMLSLFFTGNDLLSNTFQHPNPTADSNPSQHTLAYFLQLWWNFMTSTCVLFRLISSSEGLWSVLNHKHLSEDHLLFHHVRLLVMVSSVLLVVHT